MLTQSTYTVIPPYRLVSHWVLHGTFKHIADWSIKTKYFFKSEMAANLCPPQPRMNVEILLSACNSLNKLGPAGKIIVGFKIA